MHIHDFKTGMEKLKSMYGDRYWPEGRTEIIWKAIKGEDPQIWWDAVERIIGERHTAPTLSHIREAIACVRERYRRIQKINEQRQAKGFFDTPAQKLNEDEIRDRMGMIKARMRGKINDETWNDFMKFLLASARKAEA